MSGNDFVLDHAGIREILKSAGVRREVDKLARTIADNVDPRYPVLVGSYTTDRAAANVTAMNVNSLADEAKLGILTQAASAAGCEVHARSRG